MKLKAYWHMHHNKLIEFATEPIQNRIDYIQNYKPKNEVELRLKLLKPVVGKLPLQVIEAWNKTRKVQAWEKAGEAGEAWEKAVNFTILDLHKKECPDCPWDGKSIFRKRRYFF